MQSPKNQSPRISVRNLWKIFGRDDVGIMDDEWVRSASKQEIQEHTGHVVAIKNVSFDVQVGEVFVVMGLSGSGKSTLVRCLIRLVEPTSGVIDVDGEDILKYGNKELINLRREKVGMIFQHYGLLPHKQVIDNVAFGLEIRGINKATRYEKAMEVLETVGLVGWEYSYPDQLSGGMQQRVGIARALSLDPEIILMDEPFSGLDPLIRGEMQKELIDIQARVQKTIVFITHDLEEALRLGDRIGIMRDGELIQVGTASEIVALPADGYVGEFVRGVSKTKVLGAGSIMKAPDATIFIEQTVHQAVDVMQVNNVDYTLVVDSSWKILGVLTLTQAAEAVKRGVERLQDMDLSALVACAHVYVTTPIDDIIPLAARSELPVAVLDSGDSLAGVVSRSELLRSIADSNTAQGKQGAGLSGRM